MSKRVQQIKKSKKNEVIDRYQSLEDMKSIAKSCDISGTTVKKWLIEWGEYEKGSRFANTIVEMFLSGKTVDQIAQEVGFSDSGVRRALKSAGAYKNKRAVNHGALADLTNPDSLYWIGFICGDGCIWEESKTKAKRLNITSKDVDAAKRFKEFFESNHKITKNIHRKNGGVFYRIGFSSREICSQLESLGVTEKKTHTLEISDQGIVNSPDFMRGIIDADGYISKNKWKVDITTGSEKFANQLTKSISNAGFKVTCITRDREGRQRYYSVQVNGGMENVKSFLRWLNYDKSKYALNRKRELVLSLIK